MRRAITLEVATRDRWIDDCPCVPSIRPTVLLWHCYRGALQRCVAIMPSFRGSCSRVASEFTLETDDRRLSPVAMSISSLGRSSDWLAELFRAISEIWNLELDRMEYLYSLLSSPGNVHSSGFSIQ